jgi:hypothetical protein
MQVSEGLLEALPRDRPEYAAPDGAGKLFGAGFYRNVVPTALGEFGKNRVLQKGAGRIAFCGRG